MLDFNYPFTVQSLNTEGSLYSSLALPFIFIALHIVVLSVNFVNSLPSLFVHCLLECEIAKVSAKAPMGLHW